MTSRHKKDQETVVHMTELEKWKLERMAKETGHSVDDMIYFLVTTADEHKTVEHYKQCYSHGIPGSK
jgi:hypothetical protein